MPPSWWMAPRNKYMELTICNLQSKFTISLRYISSFSPLETSLSHWASPTSTTTRAWKRKRRSRLQVSIPSKKNAWSKMIKRYWTWVNQKISMIQSLTMSMKIRIKRENQLNLKKYSLKWATMAVRWKVIYRFFL